MQYPEDDTGSLGERIDSAYLPQLTLDTVTSSISGTSATMDYDAAGRVRQRSLGEQGLTTQFTCNQWGAQGGRLLAMNSVIGEATLQDLGYNYDPAGNILNIYDDSDAMGTEQTLTFTYDANDRLVSAQATGGGQGNYANQPYSYSSVTGNLSSKAGVTYSYLAVWGMTQVCMDH